MATLKLTSRLRGERFNRRMDVLLAYLNHLGILAGGWWDSKKGSALLYPYAHREGCCSRMPTLSRVTAKVRGEVDAWCRERGLAPKWSRVR